MDDETMAATIAHEMKHVQQLRAQVQLGSGTINSLEDEAYAAEIPALAKFRGEGMNDIDFTITQVWDLPSREPLLVTGTLAAGEINQGTVLRNTTTGAQVLVRGLEFHAHRGQEYTLIIDRSDAEHVQIGHRLVSATSHAPTAQ